MKDKLNELGEFILWSKEGIENKRTDGVIKKTKNKAQWKQILALQKRGLKNALKLYNKINDIPNACISK